MEESGRKQKLRYKTDNPVDVKSQKLEPLTEERVKADYRRLNFEVDLRRFPADFEGEIPLDQHPRRLHCRNVKRIESIKSHIPPNLVKLSYNLSVGSLWTQNTTIYSVEKQDYDREGEAPLNSTWVKHWMNLSEEMKEHLLQLLQMAVSETKNESLMRALITYDIPNRLPLKYRIHDVKKQGLFLERKSDLVSLNQLHLHIFNPTDDPAYESHADIRKNILSYMRYPFASYSIQETISHLHKNFQVADYPSK